MSTNVEEGGGEVLPNPRNGAHKMNMEQGDCVQTQE